MFVSKWLKESGANIIVYWKPPPPARPNCRFSTISGHFINNYLYIFHNWGSDGHFEVLNGSEPQLVQNLWHRTQKRRLLIDRYSRLYGMRFLAVSNFCYNLANNHLKYFALHHWLTACCIFMHLGQTTKVCFFASQFKMTWLWQKGWQQNLGTSPFYLISTGTLKLRVKLCNFISRKQNTKGL